MPSITIGPEFFSKSKNDYSNWRWAIVREFMQNSLDAGARKIEFDVDYIDGKTLVSCEDNGCGMSREILVDKLLSLGSSGKDFGNGAVGGFGKAKEILYFCWDSYKITTLGTVVKGSGADYSIRATPTPHKGTCSTITIDGNHAEEIQRQFTAFCAMASTSCKLFLNGQEQTARMRRGYYRRDLSFARVYTNRTCENLLVVRIGGIPMFCRTTNYKGTVVCELNGNSADSLTSNRDGLQWTRQGELDDFVSDLSVNKRKALSQKATEYIKYDGDKIFVGPGSSREATVRTFSRAPQGSSAALEGMTAVATHPIEDRLPGTHRGSYDHLLGHEFFIKNESGKKVKPAYRPDNEKFSKYADRVVAIWTALLRVVHREMQHDANFSVGFIFTGESTIAQCEQSVERGTVYYLNPLDTVGKQRWRLSPHAGRKSLNMLAAVAAHEVVHGMGLSSHDEDYAGKLTDVMAVMLGSMKEILAAYKAK